MEEKITFVEPEAEVIRFPRKDIITTSGGVTGGPVGGGGGIVLPDDEW